MNDNQGPFQRQLRKNNAEAVRLYTGITLAGIPVAFAMLFSSLIARLLGVYGNSDVVSAILFVFLNDIV